MEQLTLKNQVIFWTLVLLAFVGFIFLFQTILLPFILGIAVAYLLNPPVSALAEIGIPRMWAGLIMLLLFFLVVLALLVLVIPVLYRELDILLRGLPQAAEEFWAMVKPYIERLQTRVEHAEQSEIQDFIAQYSASALDLGKNILRTLLAGGAAVTNIVSIFILAPIVAFFVLKEWELITGWMEGLMPRDHKKTVKNLLRQIDQKLSGFVRGQLLIAFVLGTAYAILLSIAGLNYAVLIGLVSGFLNLIPLLGSTTGLIISTLVAWFQTSSLQYTLMIAAIFVGGQLIEGNILSPKLLGQSVGMHPLWVFFSLMAGASLGGIVGMLVAVPLAAAIGVLINFAIQHYKDSRYYKGQSRDAKKVSKTKKSKSGRDAS